MGAGGATYFSATLLLPLGDVTFQFGSEITASLISAINTVSAFTLVGASLNSADIAILSATQGVSFSNGGCFWKCCKVRSILMEYLPSMRELLIIWH